MKKVFVSLLLVFILSFSPSSSAADMKETISYAANVTGVSAELLKALSTSEANLLGNLGDTPEARQIFIEANKHFAYRLSWKEKETFIHLEFECIHRPYGEKLCEK